MIQGLLVQLLQGHCVVSLSKICFPLLGTGSTQEDRKSSLHGLKIVDWVEKHQHKQTS